MSKIKNPVVLVNIHDNHPNSLTVAVTDGSNDWADMRKAVVADLDEPLADEVWINYYFMSCSIRLRR